MSTESQVISPPKIIVIIVDQRNAVRGLMSPTLNNVKVNTKKQIVGNITNVFIVFYYLISLSKWLAANIDI